MDNLKQEPFDEIVEIFDDDDDSEESSSVGSLINKNNEENKRGCSSNGPIDQLEREDLEEENRLRRQCSGVIVDARRLANFPSSSSSMEVPGRSNNNYEGDIGLSASHHGGHSSTSHSSLEASCSSSSEGNSTPLNCCHRKYPNFKVNVTPPRPQRPYYIPKFKLYDDENNQMGGSGSNDNEQGACNHSLQDKLRRMDVPDVFDVPHQRLDVPSTSNVSIPHPPMLFSDYEDEEGDEEIMCTCVSFCESEEDDCEDMKMFDSETPDTTDTEGYNLSIDDTTRIWRKRKNSSPSDGSLCKRTYPEPINDGRTPEFSLEMKNWIQKFAGWSGSERLLAIDLLIKRCAADQVRHMMQAIEPLFQRDFISLLPRELALSVLSHLEPDDLLRAAQTCRNWRFLCDDNLLWKEQCRRYNINVCRRRTRSMPPTSSPWKATYMRQKLIEGNWLSLPMGSAKILKGHDDHVITCLQFYGNKILSGSDDTTLKVWSAVTGRCLRTLRGHTGGVWSSQMVGRTIISGSTDRTLRVWDANTGECLRTLIGHTSTVRCMHLHNDRVVSGSRDATLRVWSVSEGTCLRVLVGHMAAVRCVQYDGRLVVSGAYDYFVKVWNPDTGECLHTLAGHSNRVYSLQFDGIHVVSGSLDTSIIVWDVETGAKKHTLVGHHSLTSGMELRANILVSGNADSTVKVWDIISGQCLHTLAGVNKHQSAVTCLQSNSRFVITSSDDGTVKLWDLKTGEFIRNLIVLESGGSGGVVWRIRASPTKLVCAVGSRNGTEETKLIVLDFDVPGACPKCVY